MAKSNSSSRSSASKQGASKASNAIRRAISGRKTAVKSLTVGKGIAAEE